MNIHFVIHETFESPAAIANWAEDRGHQINFTRPYNNEKLPADTSDVDFLIVMGGPQCPATTEEECPYFHAKEEIALIRKVVESNKPVLGVCLGAQLLGEALGATFEHSPNREIGVFPITLTRDGKSDPFFSTLPETFPVGHWHGDMPGLTKEAKVLAVSEGCPRQIVRYAPKAYGFQCHFEFTPDAIEAMIENCSAELEQYKDLPFIQNATTLRAHDYNTMNEYLFKFLDYLETL